MKQPKTLMSILTLFALPLMLTSCEDLFGEWDKPTQQVSVSKTPGTFSFGTTSVIKGSLDPVYTNTLMLTGDGQVSYVSSNTSIATVDANGAVTFQDLAPGASGSTTITATISDTETYTYATKQISYTIQVYEGYTFRFWSDSEQKFLTDIAPSAQCQLIETSTATLDNSKIHVVKGTVNVDHDIQMTESCRFILCDNSTLNISGRLYLTSSSDDYLRIFAQSDGEEKGRLNVTASTGTDNKGVIDCKKMDIHGGIITATAESNTIKMYGINATATLTVYGGDIKGVGSGSDSGGGDGVRGFNSTGYHLVIHGGRVEGIGGDTTSGTNKGGTGICGKFIIDGDAIVIGTGGNNLANYQGGDGIYNNTFSSAIGGNAKVTATGGNSANSTGGNGMQAQGGVTISDNAQVKATGGNTSANDKKGGPGAHNGNINLKDNASFTAAAGKSGGNQDGQEAMWSTLNYYSGTFTTIGGEKGPTGTKHGKAFSDNRLCNKSTETVTFEQSDDGETWTTFTISAGDKDSPTKRYVRKTE